MGNLHYYSQVFPVEDRTLSHVQVVVGVKLRRHEPFFLSWTSGSAQGSGRHSLWIDRGVPLHFEYIGNRHPAVNREWIEQLITAANGPAGVNLADPRNHEPGTR